MPRGCDLGRAAVGLVEVPGARRRHRPCLPRVPLDRPDLSRDGPAEHLIGHRTRSCEVALCRGERCLDEAGHVPEKDVVTFFAQPQASG